MKKIVKKILYIIMILIIFFIICFILSSVFFSIDKDRISKNKKPIFCFRGTTITDGGTTFYNGLGYGVTDYNEIYGKRGIEINSSIYGSYYYDFETEEEKELRRKHYEEIMEERNEREQEALKQKELKEKEKQKELQEHKSYPQGEKINIDINNDSIFDNLKLSVGDIYNVYNSDNYIVVLCSILNGEMPKIGDTFYIEAIEKNYVYKVVLENINKQNSNNENETLEFYFSGVNESLIKTNPIIRKAK